MKKRIITIIILIVAYFLVSFVMSSMKEKNVLYIGKNFKLTINDGKYKVDTNFDKFYLKKAKVLFDNEFIDGYIKTDDNTVIVMNNKNQNIYMNDLLVAYTGNLKIKAADPAIYKFFTNTDKEIVNNYMAENEITGDISEAKKIVYDIDNDKVDEEIFYFESYSEEYQFTALFLKDGNEVQDITNRKAEHKYPTHESVHYLKLLDINDDNKYEIFVRQRNGDDMPFTVLFYEYDGDVVTEIKGEE